MSVNAQGREVIAPLWLRAVASVVDAVPTTLIGLGLWLILRQAQSSTVVLVASIAAALLSAAWAVFVWWGYATRGQGPGAQLARIQVLSVTDGTPVGWGRYFLRELIWAAAATTSVVWVILVVMMVIHPHRRGWHDLASKAVVVRQRPRATVTDEPRARVSLTAPNVVPMPPHLSKGFAAAPGAPAPVEERPAGVISSVPTAEAHRPQVPVASGWAPPPSPQTGPQVPWAEWGVGAPGEQSRQPISQVPAGGAPSAPAAGAGAYGAGATGAATHGAGATGAHAGGATAHGGGATGGGATAHGGGGYGHGATAHGAGATAASGGGATGAYGDGATGATGPYGAGATAAGATAVTAAPGPSGQVPGGPAGPGAFPGQAPQPRQEQMPGGARPGPETAGQGSWPGESAGYGRAAAPVAGYGTGPTTGTGPATGYGAGPATGYSSGPAGPGQISRQNNSRGPGQPGAQGFGQAPGQSVGQGFGHAQDAPGSYGQQPTHGPRGAYQPETRPEPEPVDDGLFTHLAPATRTSGIQRPAIEGWQLRLDDGRVIDVDGLVLIGRSPSADANEQATQLVEAGQSSRMVSKTHLAVGLDQRGVFVTDRNSTNGTAIAKANGEYQPCAPGEQVRVREGQVVSFGDRSFEVGRRAAEAR